jgi:hypothetical protein
VSLLKLVLENWMGWSNDTSNAPDLEKKREDEHSKQRRDKVMEAVGCDDNLSLCEDSLSDGRDEVMLQYGLLLQ